MKYKFRENFKLLMMISVHYRLLKYNLKFGEISWKLTLFDNRSFHISYVARERGLLRYNNWELIIQWRVSDVLRIIQ